MRYTSTPIVTKLVHSSALPSGRLVAVLEASGVDIADIGLAASPGSLESKVAPGHLIAPPTSVSVANRGGTIEASFEGTFGGGIVRGNIAPPAGCVALPLHVTDFGLDSATQTAAGETLGCAIPREVVARNGQAQQEEGEIEYVTEQTGKVTMKATKSKAILFFVALRNIFSRAPPINHNKLEQDTL